MSENKESTLELEQRNEGLATLLKVSKNLAGTLNLQQILQESVDGVCHLFGFGTAAIYILEEINVRLAATFPPLPSDFPEQFRIAKLEDHPHLSLSISTGKIVHIPNIWDEELSKSEMEVNKARDIYTLIFIPLLADKQVLGAFIVGSVGEIVDVSPFEIDLAKTLSNFAALAIKNAQLIKEGKLYAAALEKSIEQRKEAEKEREKLQSELFQVQKLDAIGQLAGGVAHDFNNQLGGIIGYADLLRPYIQDQEPLDYLNNIITLAERSSSLTDQLLLFSRKGQFQKKTIDVHQVIEEVAGILKHSISPKISIVFHKRAEESYILGDASHVQNALLNLALNARDAMQGEGVLTFRTQQLKWEEDYIMNEDFLLKSGDYIHIEVSDTGTGIDESVMARMYEPFFTTKRRGKGTGMGLAALYGTMKTHNGGVDVKSRLGEGTTFHLYFPLFK